MALSDPPELALEADVPLAPRTTLEVGGSAERFLRATHDADFGAAIHWSHARGVPLTVLGGGSNAIVPDAGVAGLVLEVATRGIERLGSGRVRVAAGEDWGRFVDAMVEDGLAGVECLAGIPGRVGATPIQNVGAYGQEVASGIERVEALDRRTGEARRFAAAECGFAYRHSRFKEEPGRWLVTHVVFALEPGGPPARRYAELVKATPEDASLEAVRDTVVALRRRKSMVLDAADPNRRSAGSFFTNPIVSSSAAADARRRAAALGLAGEVPAWDQPDGRVKLAAGWLIEQAGLPRGIRRGAVGLSSAHALALVNHGGATATELLAFAEEVRERVRDAFGVDLEREPRLLGVDG
ncbi:MAG: UDP-N-acetylmuramate dehydrogenase [Myxococcota bacterium]